MARAPSSATGTPPRPARRGPAQRGLSLVELLVATAIGALLLGGLTSVARLGVAAREQTRDQTEALAQARFALQRVALAARAATPSSLIAPPAQTSGSWFSPVAFCVNGGAALIETTPADTACAGTQVIASAVSAFSVAVPAGSGPLESATALVTITTTSGAGGGGNVTLSERVRIGGGPQ